MLKINEIFFDIQGETTFIGFPSVFVYLSGDNIHPYHSTLHPGLSNSNERLMTIEAIVEEISKYNCYIVVITGSEPLLQEEIHSLMSSLVNRNYLVLLVTNGTLPINHVNSKAIIVIEATCPDGENFNNFKHENLRLLRAKDQLKFTISSSRDYHWAKELIFKEMLFEKCNILFFANEKKLTTRTLADWIIADQLPVRLGCRLSSIFDKS